MVSKPAQDAREPEALAATQPTGAKTSVGMLKSYLKLVLLLHKKRTFSGSVCVLGNQEIWANYADLKQCFEQLGVAHRRPPAVTPHSSATFNGNPVLRELARDFVHARVFFDMLGMDEYVDMDKFDTDRPMILHDLNQPVAADLADRFGLVIDGGTVEHIFDVSAVLQNMVRMTRVGGQVMHIATFQPDHGFYSFSPCLFFDFYAANGFEDPECLIMQVDYSRILETYADEHEYFEYTYNQPFSHLLKAGNQFLIFFVARKARDTQAVALPTQGIYARDRTDAPPPVPEARHAPATPEGVSQRIPTWLRPVLWPLRPIVHLARRCMPNAARAAVKRI